MLARMVAEVLEAVAVPVLVLRVLILPVLILLVFIVPVFILHRCGFQVLARAELYMSLN